MPEFVKLELEPKSGDLVARLEGLLERAKAGEFSSMAYAFVYPDGSTGSGWSQLHNTASMIGAVAMLQHKLCDDTL